MPTDPRELAARRDRRTYVGEYEWVVGELFRAHSDRNPNRAAQINALLQYANKVGIARRSREPLPSRPDIRNVM